MNLSDPKTRFYIKYAAAVIALALLFFVLFIKSVFWLKLILFIIFMVMALVAMKLDFLVNRFLKAAGPGVGNLLKRLPDNFTVFNNVTIEGHTLDYIIIGPTGIDCLLELNWKGEVVGGGKNWTVNGNSCLNPVPVVMEPVKLLEDRTKKLLNKPVPVRPLIVFTDEAAKIKASSYAVPLIKYKGLTKYLNSNLSGQKRLSPEEITKIAALIKPSVK